MTIMHVLVASIICAIILGCMSVLIPALKTALAVLRQPINLTMSDDFELPSPMEQARINRQLAPLTCSKEA